MKLLFGWLSDPFLHIAAVGVLVFVFLQGGRSKDENTQATMACGMCNKVHDTRQLCSNYAPSVMRD